MIVSLNGKLIEAGIFRAVIECAGVGYEVNIPVSTAEKLPDIGGNVDQISPLFSKRTCWQASSSPFWARSRSANSSVLLISFRKGAGRSVCAW